jgi:hypothetical protein
MYTSLADGDAKQHLDPVKAKDAVITMSPKSTGKQQAPTAPPGITLPARVTKSELIVVGKLEPWETHQMLSFKGTGQWAKFRYATVNIQVSAVLKGNTDLKTVPIRFCVGYADRPELDTVPGQYQTRTEGVWVLSRDHGHLVGPCFPIEQKNEIVTLINQP